MNNHAFLNYIVHSIRGVHPLLVRKLPCKWEIISSHILATLTFNGNVSDDDNIMLYTSHNFLLVIKNKSKLLQSSSVCDELIKLDH